MRYQSHNDLNPDFMNVINMFSYYFSKPIVFTSKKYAAFLKCIQYHFRYRPTYYNVLQYDVICVLINFNIPVVEQ